MRKNLIINDNVTLKIEGDGWGILHDSYLKQSFCINPVGAFIVTLLRESGELSDLVDSMNKKYGPLSESNLKDIETFVEELRALKIIDS